MDSVEAYHTGVSDGKQGCVRITQNTATRRLLGVRALEEGTEDRRLRPLLGSPVFHIVQRPAAEGRETGTEDEPGVGEVGIGDDAFGDDRLRFLEVWFDELLGELGRYAACGAFPRPAVLPDVEAAAGFLAEISRGD